MSSIDLQGMTFSFRLLDWNKRNDRVRVEIVLKNEYLSYQNVSEDFSRDEIETLTFAIHRLLAGAYAKEMNFSFEGTGVAVDLYPHPNAWELNREARRKADCVAAFRLLLKRSDGEGCWGGVFSLLLHRNDLSNFAEGLRIECEEYCIQRVHGSGKYHFVGVSPLGYEGCNYWYLDETKKVKVGDYVWVRMGKHNLEQIVCVDSARRFGDEDAPYDPLNVKRVIRKATEEEVRALETE